MTRLQFRMAGILIGATWLVGAGVVVGTVVLAVVGDVGDLAAPAAEPQLWFWILAAGTNGGGSSYTEKEGDESGRIAK